VETNNPKHILVIRLSAMGDVAMVVPVLMALYNAYPELRITILTKDFFKPILEQIPNVTVYKADVKGKHKGFFGLWSLFLELKSLNIDAVADLHNVLRSNILKKFFLLYRIPFYQIDKGRPEKKALTAKHNKIFENLKPMHERYADVFRLLGFSFQLTKEHVYSKSILEQEVTLKLGLKSKKLIGIAPYAAFIGKRYPLNLMEKVVKTLSELEDYQILLFGGGDKEQMQLEQWSAAHNNCVSVPGKITFLEELKVISNLNVMLSMDSGNAHLAAMYGVPVVSIWGVTHPYAGFYPYGQDKNNALLSNRDLYPLIPTSVYGNKVPEGYENAMETITPEQIVDKIKSVLNIF
tara:strand:+ start:46802 stop:47851 length:1050 start_codon:yes stop_codon:yes gene_type:complete